MIKINGNVVDEEDSAFFGFNANGFPIDFLNLTHKISS